MKNVLITIQPDGTVEYKPLTAVPSLKELQEAVGGGLIETVPFFSTYGNQPCVAFCNEEGKLKGMQTNETATHAWNELGYYSDFLVGPVAIVVGEQSFLDLL